ncbi:MAG: FHA domain-containing protein [Minicystis sp.]
MDGSFSACCGACELAAEVARAGGAAPNPNPHLTFARGADGVPVGTTLVVRLGDGAPELHPVQKARVVLGRTAGADIVVPDSVLSRRQCAFDFSTGEVVIEDLDSTCGTFVNGESVTSRALRAGDVVSMANVQIEVRSG